MSNQLKQVLFLFTLIFIFISSGIASPPNTFYSAKKIAQKLFNSKRETLYCACKYNAYNEIDLLNCNMESAHSVKRAHRVEWEHMMPAENFGHHFQCWQSPVCQSKRKPFKGRRCCEKIDSNFKKIEAELYNLWPSVGLVNQARSNYRFSMLTPHTGFYGCTIEINSKQRKVEPPDRAKGIVARANLFMADKYHIQLSKAQHRLFKVWNKQFPPTAWEKIWASKVAQIEGYPNPYINNAK